jgi:hypothetical protein
VRSMPPAYSSAYFAAMRNLVAEGGIADWGWSDLPLARSPSRPSRKSGLVEQRSCLSGDEAEAAADSGSCCGRTSPNSTDAASATSNLGQSTPFGPMASTGSIPFWT